MTNHQESKVESRNRSRGVIQQNRSIPLLSSLVLMVGPISPRSISSTRCCTFRGRAQPIFGDYSVSHPVSNLFSSRPASSKYTKREDEIPLQGTGLARHSHPITTSNGSVGLGSFNTSGTALNDFAAGSGNDTWLGSTGSMLRSRSTSSSGIGTGTSRLIFLVLGGLLAGSLSNGLSIFLIFVNGPVKDIVVLETLTNEEIAKDLSKVGVVRLVIEAERACVIEIDGKLVREAAAEDFSWRGHLLLHDAVILLLLCSRLQTLPGE